LIHECNAQVLELIYCLLNKWFRMFWAGRRRRRSIATRWIWNDKYGGL